MHHSCEQSGAICMHKSFRTLADAYDIIHIRCRPVHWINVSLKRYFSFTDNFQNRAQQGYSSFLIDGMMGRLE